MIRSTINVGPKVKFEIGCGKFFVRPTSLKRKFETKVQNISKTLAPVSKIAAPTVGAKSVQRKLVFSTKSNGGTDEGGGSTKPVKGDIIPDDYTTDPVLKKRMKTAASLAEASLPENLQRCASGRAKSKVDVRRFFLAKPIPLGVPKGAKTIDLQNHPRYYSFERQMATGKYGGFAKGVTPPFTPAKGVAPPFTPAEIVASPSSISSLEQAGVEGGATPLAATPSGTTSPPLTPDQIRQRGTLWFKWRMKTVTGSKLIDIVCPFQRLAHVKTWYETYQPDSPILAALIASVPELEKKRDQERMAWGTYHEEDSLATIVHELGDKLDLDFFETTLSKIGGLPPPAPRAPAREEKWNRVEEEKDRNGQEEKIDNGQDNLTPEQRRMVGWSKRFFGGIIARILKEEFGHEWIDGVDDLIWSEAFKSSPDFAASERKTGYRILGEIKDPYGDRSPHLYPGVPYYYYLQLQHHLATDMAAVWAMFVCWTPGGYVAMRVERDTSFYKMILPSLIRFHWSGLQGKVPNPLPRNRFSMDVIKYCEEAVANCIEIARGDSCYSLRGGVPPPLTPCLERM